MRQQLALLTLLALLCATPVLAGEPYLVKDINTDFYSEDSEPNEFSSLGGKAVFAATTAAEGRELWASDGTERGTLLLADICPGDCPGNPERLAVTSRGYFFTAQDGTEGELWVTRGTPASTFRLAEDVRFSFGFRLTAFLEARGLLFFLADDGDHGLELWRTDGTPAGTFLAADIRPGSLGSESREIWAFAGRVFFSANDGVTGPSLWASDGTPAGTRLIKDTWPGSSDSLVQGGLRGFRPTSRFLYFFAPGPQGLDLWRSDGTTKGTRFVADLVPGPGSPLLLSTWPLGSRFLFVAETDDKGDEVWVSDGTRAGTQKITNFPKPLPFISIHPLLPLGNRLVFAADDGVHGREIWVTDGTPIGTRLLLDVFPGPGSGVSALSQVYKGRFVFSGTDGRRGLELWTSDGTPQGTRMIRDICPGSCSSLAFPFGLLGDRLLLRADDGRNGMEIWQTDGTPAGTVRVSDFEAPSPFAAGAGFKGAAASGRFLFAHKDAIHGEELWVTDGTRTGTRLLADLNDANQASSFPSSFMRLGNTLLFAAGDGQLLGLWKSNGTAAGTTLVRSFIDPADPATYLDLGDWEEAGGILFFTLRLGSEPLPTLWRTDGTGAGTFQLDLGDMRVASELRAVGDKLFFSAQDEDFNYRLWKSDGTPEGTQIVTEIDWGSSASAPAELTSFQGKLFFTASELEESLWVSDGTAAGTIPVQYFARKPISLTVHRDFLYFYADGAEHAERELWRTDGTNATVLAAEMPSRFDIYQPLFTTSAGPLLFLWNLTVEGQGGLWVSNGTTGGTRRVSPVYLASPFFVPPVALDGIVYFFGAHGTKETLWRSDGTSAGTFPILDPDGLDFRLSYPFAVSGGLLFFAQSAPDVPLWQSDGTKAGTFRLRELAPGLGFNGTTGPPFAVGPRVFFQAHDPATGTELWAIDTRED